MNYNFHSAIQEQQSGHFKPSFQGNLSFSKPAFQYNPSYSLYKNTTPRVDFAAKKIGKFFSPVTEEEIDDLTQQINNLSLEVDEIDAQVNPKPKPQTKKNPFMQHAEFAQTKAKTGRFSHVKYWSPFSGQFSTLKK